MNDDIIRMAREAGFAGGGCEALFRFAALARADEREACAKVCDKFAHQDETGYGVAEDCAAAIRARSKE